MKLKRGDLIFGYYVPGNEFWIARINKPKGDECKLCYTGWYNDIQTLMKRFAARRGWIIDSILRPANKKDFERFYNIHNINIYFLDAKQDLKEQIERALVMERL